MANTYTDPVKIIELKESVLEDNNKDAQDLRSELKALKTCLLNLMSGPGSGKTTTLLALDKYLRGRLNWGVMEADIDSDVGHSRGPAAHRRNVPSGRRHDEAGPESPL